MPVSTENNWINIAEKCALCPSLLKFACIFGRRRVQHLAPPVDEVISEAAEPNEPYTRAAVLYPTAPPIIAAAAATGGHYCLLSAAAAAAAAAGGGGLRDGVGGEEGSKTSHKRVERGK